MGPGGPETPGHLSGDTMTYPICVASLDGRASWLICGATARALIASTDWRLEWTRTWRRLLLDIN